MFRPWPIFQVAYGSTYFLLYLIVIGLLLIVPTDIIQRSIRQNQRDNVWLLIIFYAITISIVVFIYLLRLYVSRTELSNVPKAWIPIEPGDLNKATRKMIVAGLDRSATIAYEARPRDDNAPAPVTIEGLGISKALQSRIWSGIEHYGWASPNSPDLPNLQYSTVLSELPNLIEAKALTLAPPDPTATFDAPVINPEAAALLQRPAYLGLRGYLEHLATLGVVRFDETTAAFLQHYEYSRFSTRPLSNAQFRELMHLFAEVLRAMEPLDLAAADEDGAPSLSSDQDDPAAPLTQRDHLTRTITASTQSSVRRPSQQNRPWARGSPGDAKRPEASSSSFSGGYARSVSSSLSMRSAGSGSVIRLATRDDDEDSPYVLNLRGTVDSFCNS